ncbi:MAG: hypothetical protein LCI00_31690 [Chloroflexi bacterium]|nr:hypothetical protein [Chloroflexota bacterium]MCC6893628.1 hypothetical protein [Anaerolineae bacterium]
MYRDELHGLARLDYHDRNPVYFISVGFGGYSEDFQKHPKNIWEDATQGKIRIYAEREIYKYAEAKIVEINLTRWHNSFNAEIGLKENAANIDYRLAYDTDGKLNQITSQVRPYKYVKSLYRKRQAGETLDALAERAKSKLIDNIPNVIASTKFSERLYCLQLRFSDTHFFPPILIPGFESRRQRLLKELSKPYGPNEIWAQVWESEESTDDPFPPWQIDDEETLEACEHLQIEVGMRGNKSRSDFGLRSLRQVAKALNKLDWSQYTSVTDDFIVFAYDQESLGMALHLSGATPDQIASWRKYGLL